MSTSSAYEPWLKWDCVHHWMYVGPAMVITQTNTTASLSQKDIEAIGFATQKVMCTKCGGYSYIQIPIGEKNGIQNKVGCLY